MRNVKPHSHHSQGSQIDVGALIAELSIELDVSREQAGEIFRAQLSRLSAEARIRDFLPVLALRNTKAILRGSRRV